MNIRLTLYSVIFITYHAAAADIEETKEVDGVDTSLEPETLYHHTHGQPDILRHYETKIVSRAIALSQDKYGPINYKRVEKGMSINRLSTELDKAVNIHLDVGSNTHIPHNLNIELLEIGIYRSLLGLRKAIIKKPTRKMLRQISTKSDVLALSVGQGKNWFDATIYKNAGIRVVETQKFSTLIPMLTTGRFDLLPLGIIEIEDAVEAFPDHKHHLETLEHFYIYYPMTTYIRISGRYPRLVSRMREGFGMLSDSGELDALFQEQFSDLLSNIDPHKATLVLINNPKFNANDNQRLANTTINRFFSNQTKIIDMRQ